MITLEIPQLQLLAKRFDFQGAIVTRNIELIRITILYTSAEKAESLQRTLGIGAVRLRYKSLDGHNTWEYRVSGQGFIVDVLQAIKPYLVEMKGQAQAVLDYYNLDKKRLLERARLIGQMKREPSKDDLLPPEAITIPLPTIVSTAPFTTDKDVTGHRLYQQLEQRCERLEANKQDLIKTNREMAEKNEALRKELKEQGEQFELLRERYMELKYKMKVQEGTVFDINSLPLNLLNPSAQDSVGPDIGLRPDH